MTEERLRIAALCDTAARNLAMISQAMRGNAHLNLGKRELKALLQEIEAQIRKNLALIAEIEAASRA